MLVPSMDAFRIGYWRSAAAAARTTNGKYVRPNPYCAWNCAFTRSRILATRVISTLCTVVTCAEVCLENTMCSAIFCRMLLIGSMRLAGASPGNTGRGTSTVCGIVATACACGGGAAWRGGGACGGGAGGCGAGEAACAACEAR